MPEDKKKFPPADGALPPKPPKGGPDDKEEEVSADELRQMMKKNNTVMRGPGAGRTIDAGPARFGMRTNCGNPFCASSSAAAAFTRTGTAPGWPTPSGNSSAKSLI